MRFNITESSDWNGYVNKAYVEDFRKAGLKVEGEFKVLSSLFDPHGIEVYEDVYVTLETAEDFWKLRSAAGCEIIIGTGLVDGMDRNGVPVLEIYNTCRE